MAIFSIRMLNPLLIRRTMSEIPTMGKPNSFVLQMIDECKDERDVDCRSEMLQRINSMLPEPLQIQIPSLITNDYINTALYRIEQSLLVAS